MQHITTTLLDNGDIDGLIRFHRETFGGFVMEGEEIEPAVEVEGQAPVETVQTEVKPDEQAVPEEVVPPVETEEAKPKLTYEELEAEVTKVRKEAADRRVKAKALEDKLSSAKTKEEVEEILATDRADSAAANHTLLVENVALTFKLPPKLAARLKGETREELEADAKELQEFAPEVEETPGELSGGLNPNNGDTGFDPVKTAREARATRY